jgi:hypothetical protein
MAQQSAARRASLCEQDGPPVDAPAPVSRILLVDDDAGLLRSSATVLRDAGFDVDTCGGPGRGAPARPRVAARPVAARPALRREKRRRGARLLAQAVQARAEGYLVKSDDDIIMSWSVSLFQKKGVASGF